MKSQLASDDAAVGASGQAGYVAAPVRGTIEALVATDDVFREYFVGALLYIGCSSMCPNAFANFAVVRVIHAAEFQHTISGLQRCTAIAERPPCVARHGALVGPCDGFSCGTG